MAILREEIGWDELVKTVAGDSRFPAPGATGQCWRVGGELWRAGGDGDSWACIPSADADQYDEFGMVARVSYAAADYADCAWVFAAGCGQGVYVMQAGWKRKNSEGVKNKKVVVSARIFLFAVDRDCRGLSFWAKYQSFG